MVDDFRARDRPFISHQKTKFEAIYGDRILCIVHQSLRLFEAKFEGSWQRVLM